MRSNVGSSTVHRATAKQGNLPEANTCGTNFGNIIAENGLYIQHYINYQNQNFLFLTFELKS
jgi:hypothetical protein